MISDSQALLESVAVELETQTAELPRREILAKALTHARLILSRDIPQAIEISNRYAPEHLILQVEQPRQWLERVRSAGSIFLGALAPEALGDYCSGTNHVLPTSGAARFSGGLNVASFQVAITVQEVQPQGLVAIGPCAVIMLLVGVQPMPLARRESRSLAGKPFPRTWPDRSQVQIITISSGVMSCPGAAAPC